MMMHVSEQVRHVESLMCSNHGSTNGAVSLNLPDPLRRVESPFIHTIDPSGLVPINPFSSE